MVPSGFLFFFYVTVYRVICMLYYLPKNARLKISNIIRSRLAGRSRRYSMRARTRVCDACISVYLLYYIFIYYDAHIVLVRILYNSVSIVIFFVIFIILIYALFFCYRCVFEQVDTETATVAADGASQRHLPHVSLSAGVRQMVLSQRSHVFRHQNRRVAAVQLRVSTLR